MVTEILWRFDAFSSKKSNFQRRQSLVYNHMISIGTTKQSDEPFNGSDQKRISLYNINTIISRNVMRIKKDIN